MLYHVASCLLYSSMIQYFLIRLEEIKTTQQQYLETLEKYENEHMGGFRRIYPKETSDKYTHFFENSCSLFQTTTAAKAREEAARYVSIFEANHRFS